MKRTFKLYLTKADMDTVRAVHDEIIRLDPGARFEGAAGAYEAWVYDTELTDKQIRDVMWVVRAVQASKGRVKGRKFNVGFQNPLKPYSRFEIEAMQEWINVDHWGRRIYPADEWDLDPVRNLFASHEPIGDMQYDLRTSTRYTIASKYDTIKQTHRTALIGRYKTLEAALDTLMDMGMINQDQKNKAIRMQETGSYGGDL